ncbi:MAG TPA: ABC transporter permease [Aggregatilineales bacterium]|nr:ABC transporter permease [Aggregatilineales bacterium]
MALALKRARSNLQIFWDGAYLSYIALFHWLQPMTYLASKIVMPLAQLMFFSLLGSYATGASSLSFYVIGNAIQLTAVNGIFGVTFSIGGDRNEGTLPYLFATPANRFVLFVGRAFMHILDGMLGIVVGLTWGVLLLGLDLSKTNPLALALIILVTTFSTSGLGLLLGCTSLMTLNAIFINNTFYFVLLIFSGANLDLATMPVWIQTISRFLPLSRGITAARRVIAGAPLGDVWLLIFHEFLIGVAYVLVGYTMFRAFEYQAKRRGTLEAI